MEFSVLISIYKNEKGEYFKAALESIVNQTLKPNEIVIVNIKIKVRKRFKVPKSCLVK